MLGDCGRGGGECDRLFTAGKQERHVERHSLGTHADQNQKETKQIKMKLAASDQTATESQKIMDEISGINREST